MICTLGSLCGYVENRLMGSTSACNYEGVSIVKVGDMDGLNQEGGSAGEERPVWTLAQSR